MKKIFTGFGVVLVLCIIAGLAALPWLGGKISEKVIYNEVASANEMYRNSGQDIKVEISDYKRGYSSSTFTTQYTSPIFQKLLGSKEPFIVETTAKHGLTGITAVSNLQKNSWYKIFVTEAMAGKDPLHITTTYQYSGTVTGDITLDKSLFTVENDKIKAIATAAEDMEKLFTVKPLALHFVTNKNFDKYTITADWQGFSGLVDGETFDFAPSKLRSEIEKISSYFWLYDSEYSSEKIEFTAEDGQKVNIVDPRLAIKTTINEDKTRFSVEEKVSIKSIQQKEERIDSIAGSLSIKNINLERYEEFFKEYIALLKSLSKSVENAEEGSAEQIEILEKQIKAAGFRIMPQLEKLLTKDLEIHLADVRYTIASGEVSGDVHLQLKDDLSFAQCMPVLTGNPQVLLKFIDLKTSAALPKAVVENEQRLFMPVMPPSEATLFVLDNDRAVHAAETRDGKLYLNEKEVLF